MKKVLILTMQPLLNYGGIIQAYALQSYLNSIGYLATTTSPTKISPSRELAMNLKRLLRATRRGERFVSRRKEIKVASLQTSKFVFNRIATLDFKLIRSGNSAKFDAIVIGSDQVWRSKYVYVPDYLLDDIPFTGVRISYAASFGTDDPTEYTRHIIEKSKPLAKKLSAISVRETSGQSLTKELWGIQSQVHIDPTLLLSREHYLQLIEDSTCTLPQASSGIFVYTLDKSKNTLNIIDKTTAVVASDAFSIIDKDENNGRPMPPVEQWLRSFRDAKYVITDSFHGMVFSIIFNKPFIAIGNKERGLARFTSLLKMFALEDRLVTSAGDVTEELINKEIDWDAVNAKIKAEQKRSFDYLKKHLG